MNHLTHEEIVLCYYGEPERADHVEHLASCEQCQKELGRIATVLDRVALDVPEPEDGYETRVWERLSWRLRGEKKHARRMEWTKWLAAAAVLILAFLGGLFFNRRAPIDERYVAGNNPAPQAQPAASTPQQQQQQRDRILLVVVGNHFDQSERILVELTNLTPGDDLDITAERDRAQNLLTSNRLYRRTASDRGEDSVATLLDDLEPVLMQIAHAPSNVSADELRRIQKRVEAKGLVLKLRVLRADVRETSAARLNQPNV